MTRITSVLTGDNIETQFFKAGATIFREGYRAQELFVVKSGEVRIQIGNRTVSELSDDHIFGEMALIDSEPRSSTAIAVTDVELVPVSEKQFLFLVSQTAYFALRVMRVLAPAASDDEQDVWLTCRPGAWQQHLPARAVQISGLAVTNLSPSKTKQKQRSSSNFAADGGDFDASRNPFAVRQSDNAFRRRRGSPKQSAA